MSKSLIPTSTLPKPRLVWRDDETRILLKSWKSHLHLHRLLKKGCSKHPLYYAIAKDLQTYGGFRRSMREIYFKMKNMGKKLRNIKKTMPVNGHADFKFFKELDELLKMEAEVLAEGNPTVEPQIIHVAQQPDIVLDGSYDETIASENLGNVQVITLDVPHSQDVSDSNALSYTVISHSEPEVQNEPEVIQATPPVSSGSNSQNASENILLDFYQEFERSNRQLEMNDAAMLELFKEQNEIFRTQTTLLMKLLLK